MKLKINKACDLSSISVLPPYSRRANMIPSGTDSSAFGKIQASQLRSQQSQQSFSQGMYSQLSQNSLDDILTNEQRFGSQERENSAKRISCLAPITCTREDNQMSMSRSSNNLMRRWSSAPAPDHRCQVSEELEHKIRLIETSLNRFGMILDSVQSDVMQVNKAIKEVSLDTEGIRQKLTGHDNLLQLMLKGEEDIKASLDGNSKSIFDQLRKDSHHYKLREIVMTLSALPDQIEAQLLKLQSEFHQVFTKEMETMTSSMKPTNHKDLVPSIQPSKRRGCCVNQPQKEQLPFMENPVVPPKICTQRSQVSMLETKSQDPLKPELASFTDRQHNIKLKHEDNFLTEQDREWRILIESDEEIDGGFFCLLEEKEAGMGSELSEDVKGETERILRRARRKKRKYCNAINLN